jgi:formylglycine-generating enzyme required for sulfatase activity
MTTRLHGILSAIFLLLLTANLSANDIVVSNISLTDENATEDYVMVQFDLSWENSWRISSGPANWDAAWVFVKYRLSGGEWQHASLNNNGHSGAAAAIDAGLLDPGSAFNASTNPALGVFIYRSADGTGTVSMSGAQLRWNYGANGLSDDAIVDVKVFAIEMVYVSEGAFAAGSGGSETSCFTLTTINTANATTAPTGAGSLGGQAGGYPTGQTAPDNASWPNGFSAFYCMKYEISQQQYVDFLNTLTQTQANNRKYNGSDYRYAITGTTIGSYATTNPYVACNFLSWMDGAAYSDWAGLRPMTELEYEKACRGTVAPVANEYAWGTNTVAGSAYTLDNDGAADEGITANYSTSAGNASYMPTDGGIDGPLRVGIFAANAANSGRITAGASYYGIMELSGNLYERTVTVGNPEGRAYTGVHGNGILSGNGKANETAWPGFISGEVTVATGSGFRGGGFSNFITGLQVSDRNIAAETDNYRYGDVGFRSVRSVQ